MYDRPSVNPKFLIYKTQLRNVFIDVNIQVPNTVFLGCWSSLPACLRIFISISVVAGKDSFHAFWFLCVIPGNLCLCVSVYMHLYVWLFVYRVYPLIWKWTLWGACSFVVVTEVSTRRRHPLRPCSCFWQLDPYRSLHLLRAYLIIFPLILHPKHRFEGYLKCNAGNALLGGEMLRRPSVGTPHTLCKTVLMLIPTS